MSTTETKLSKIFINLAKGERKSEISRQVLCDNSDFNPFQLFKLLDIENKNYINSTNIINFLNSKGISVNNLEAQLLILFYDQNFDGVLSYNEFLCLIKNQNSIKESSNQNNYNININNISFNLDYSFTKLLEKEIELSRKIIQLLSDIQNNKNFDIHELYHKVIVSDYIDEKGIINFLDKNCESFLDSDIDAILRRLDLNKDGRVDLCEFHAFLGFPKCCCCCPCEPCEHCGTCYCKICFCDYQCHYHECVHKSFNSQTKNNKNLINNKKKTLDYEMNSYSSDNNIDNINYNNNYNQEEKGILYNNDYNDNLGNNIKYKNNNYNYKLNNGSENKYDNINDNIDDNNMINNKSENNYKGFSMKTKQILENNYQPSQNQSMNNGRKYNGEIKEIILNNSDLNNNENENGIQETKITKTLAIRRSPERKHAPKMNNNNFINLNKNNSINIVNNIKPINLYNKNEYKNNYENYNSNSRTFNNKNYEENQRNNIRPYNQDDYEENQRNNVRPYNQDDYEENQRNNISPYNQDDYEENQRNNIRHYNQDEYEENQFNDYIKQIMLAENQIEKIKVDLSLCPDFNCEDCFRIFELDGKGKLYPDDIKYGLRLIGVFASDFEIKLLFKRFDLQKRGYINYSDFFDIFVPFQKEYRTIVEERKPNSCCPCRCPDVFCPETLSILKNLMDAIIKHENNFNFLRRGFTTLNLKLNHIFENIDFLKMGYFTNNDLIVYLKKNNIYIDSLNTDLLFIRLDKNRNGKIDYKEIYDETHPLYL